MESYIKYKAYYDRKAAAHPLHVNEYCFALHPKANNQSTKLPFKEYIWTGPYKIVKVLPNNNYIIRRLNSDKTQILHRMRLRPFPTQNVLQDDHTPQEPHTPDDEVPIKHDDLYANAWETLDPLENSENPLTRPAKTPPEINVPPTIIIQPDSHENSTIIAENDINNTSPEQGEHLDRLPEIQKQGEHLDRLPEIHKQGEHLDRLPESQNSGQHPDDVPDTQFTENDIPTPKTMPRGDKYNYRRNPPSKRHSDYIYYDTY